MKTKYQIQEGDFVIYKGKAEAVVVMAVPYSDSFIIEFTEPFVTPAMVVPAGGQISAFPRNLRLLAE